MNHSPPPLCVLCASAIQTFCRFGQFVPLYNISSIALPFFFLLSGLILFPAAIWSDEPEQKLLEMTFDIDAHRWQAGNNCRAFIKDGLLHIEAVGGEPSLMRLVDEIGGSIRLVLRVRTTTRSAMTFYWTTQGSPRRSEEQSVKQPLIADGQWHDYDVLLNIPDLLTGGILYFDASEGTWEVDSIISYIKRTRPLAIKNIVQYSSQDADGVQRDRLRYTISNKAPIPLTIRAEHLDQEIELPEDRSIDFAVPIKSIGNLAAVNLTLFPKSFSRLDFPVFLYLPDGKTDWLSRKIGTENSSTTLQVDPAGRMARLCHGDKVFAIIAPLVHRNGRIPDFKLTPEEANNRTESDTIGSTFRFTSPELNLELEIVGHNIRFLIEPVDQGDASEEMLYVPEEDLPIWEGPVVRLFGTLRSGLLPGVEFLGPGDTSSSEIDIESPDNERSIPDPLWVTMPLAVLETEIGEVVLHWTDMTLQPTFSSPNQFDRTADHRMSLRGRRIEATLEIPEASDQSTHAKETAAIRALMRNAQRQGFPPPGEALRSESEQASLSLQAFHGSLGSVETGQWGYALEPDWPRKPFADPLSTLTRLTTKTPEPKDIVSGGADIANDAIYFLTGKVEQWKLARDASLDAIVSLRNPDGSFFYRTRFPEVESSITSAGHTAVRALEIMEYVRLTGDRDLFEMVQQSLEYLDKCDIPRGGFYQDTPLHTPDLFAAGVLLWLHIWAYEFSGEKNYLDRAKRFAYAGLPFVYQWSDRENMLYTAVPKFGGTERIPPLWFATMQMRVALVYAYALTILAKHDQTVDWLRPAWGILHAVERLQYTDGPETGCVPDVFVLRTQQRQSWKVNPCALVSLRLALEGKVDSLAVVLDGPDRYASPYPLRITPQGIIAEGVPLGRTFQVLLNGSRIINGRGSGPLSLD